VIDVEKNKEGILSYSLAVRSLDGSGRHERGMVLDAQANQKRVRQSSTPVTFMLRNTGTAAETDTALHPADAGAYLNSDVYRLSVSVEGKGWSAQLLNGLAAVETGMSQMVTVYVSQKGGNASPATVILRATSESDPSKTAAASVQISR
jgi:hypothetical protein